LGFGNLHLKPSFDGVDDLVEGLDPRPPLPVAFDDSPRRIVRVGLHFGIAKDFIGGVIIGFR
jgi:hypothetical protein